MRKRTIYDNPNLYLYDQKYGLEEAERPFNCAGILADHVRGKTLDVGAGHGKMTRALTKKSTHVTLIEGTEYNIKVLKKDGWNDIVKHNIDTFPWPVKPGYDTVISTDVIEHILSPYLHLVEIHRLLKKGGALILSTPNIRKSGVAEMHIFYSTPESMRAMLERAGFRKITYVYNGVINERMTRLTSKIPILRNLLDTGSCFVAIK